MVLNMELPETSVSTTSFISTVDAPWLLDVDFNNGERTDGHTPLISSADMHAQEMGVSVEVVFMFYDLKSNEANLSCLQRVYHCGFSGQAVGGSKEGELYAQSLDVELVNVVRYISMEDVHKTT
jgi:hypothetical protein